MKITGTDTYLQVALHTLETKIAPELKSGEAQASAEILKQVLGELIKREHATAPLLAEHVTAGEQLAGRMAAFCRKAQINIAQDASSPPAHADTRFELLAARHAKLTRRIAGLAEALAAHRAAAPGEAQPQISALLYDVALWDQSFASTQRDMIVPKAESVRQPAGTPLNRDLLEAFLQTQHPDGRDCAVVEMQPIPGGFGKQTFRATLRDAEGALQRIIVRKSDPTPMVKKGCFLIEQEFHLLRDVARNSDLPVARPLWLGKTVPGVDADFYVMSALPGAVPSSFLGAASAVIPETILLQMAGWMARLHRLELASLPDFLSRFGHPDLATDTIQSCYRRSIREWKAYYEEGDHLPSPFVTYLLDWLEQNLPAHHGRPVLVHGDFNIHNVLAENGHITGILDWECSNIGAPEQDLAYVKAIVSKHIDWDRFLAAYREAGGPELDLASLNFYQAFSAMRLCVIFNKGVRNMQDGVTRDIRYAVIDLGLTPEFMNQALACTTAGR